MENFVFSQSVEASKEDEWINGWLLSYWNEYVWMNECGWWMGVDCEGNSQDLVKWKEKQHWRKEEGKFKIYVCSTRAANFI